jgi:hypothetical protein
VCVLQCIAVADSLHVQGLRHPWVLTVGRTRVTDVMVALLHLAQKEWAAWRKVGTKANKQQ